jgi:very-short-patch-repair endonuclease
MRHHATFAENALWQCLRDRQLAGAKFRRQVPIGKYIVDFCCRESRSVIEIDGSQHEQQQEYDAQRTKFLTANEYRVIRFSNTDVLAGIEGVLIVVGAALEGPALGK